MNKLENTEKSPSQVPVLFDSNHVTIDWVVYLSSPSYSWQTSAHREDNNYVFADAHVRTIDALPLGYADPAWVALGVEWQPLDL